MSHAAALLDELAWCVRHIEEFHASTLQAKPRKARSYVRSREDRVFVAWSILTSFGTNSKRGARDYEINGSLRAFVTFCVELRCDELSEGW